MEVLLDSDYVLVRYLSDNNAIEVIWRPKQMTKDEYLNAFEKALESQRKYKAEYFISDIREQKIISPKYRKSFQEDIIPRAKEGGLKKGIVIFSGNIFKKYYLNNIMNTTKKIGIEFKFFNRRDRALDWIQK